MGKSQELYIKQAKKMIPGGTQLLSKRPEMLLPELWPAYYQKAKGCEVWDLDGKKYFDMSYMGIGVCILGYADKDVDSAVRGAVRNGSAATLNCPEEIELSRLLFKIHPWAKMARYARTGGEAMSIAVRIARAKTGKDLILFCGYHGWHDWYLAANIGEKKNLDGHLLPGLKPRGVPRVLKKTAVPFEYNNSKALNKLIKGNKNKVAAVVMEPIRNRFPKNGFLEDIRKITKKLGIVLIFDEITSGWRFNLGGAHLKFGVNPDIAVFAKGISNGYPMAAIIGKKEVMKAAEETFISSTYWTERIGPTAAIATIKKLKDKNVSGCLLKIGRRVQDGWKHLARKNNLDIEVTGTPALGHFSFKHKNPLVLKTLFTQLMLQKGFLASNAFYASFAHKDYHINKYLIGVDDAFSFISKAIKKGDPKKYLKGPVCQEGFKRLT